MSYIYIASPYSHPDSKVRAKRYLQASYYVVSLLAQHKHPYSPIVSNHHLAQEFGIKSDANTWMAYNFAMLSSAKELHILTLPGWEDSVGVLAELNFWRGARQEAPYFYITYDHSKMVRNSKRLTGMVQCAPVLKDGLTST